MAKSSFKRDRSVKKALRNKHILKAVFGYEEKWCQPLHYYSKNKIFCSCCCCSPKTRNKGKRRTIKGGNFNPSLNYKPCDKRKIESLDLQEYEYQLNEDN
jgi:hypothetical protein